MLPAAPRLLLVEADADLREFYRHLFAFMLPTVAIDLAEDGLEARGLAVSRRYSVMICDMLLPRMDGLSLLRSLEEHHPIPTIVITALGVSRAAPARVLSTVLEVLYKPVPVERIIAEVQHVLGREGYRLAG